MELAATEKAKVWTSVRMRYFTVESTSPDERRRGGRACGDLNEGSARAEGGEFSTAFGSCYQRVADGRRGQDGVCETDFIAHSFIPVKVIKK